MSAVAFAPARRLDERAASQRRLFAVEGAVDAQTPTAAPVAAGRTLAAVVDARWAELAAGSLAACLLCGAAMEPRWSAGGGIVGGRCRSCGTCLD